MVKGSPCPFYWFILLHFFMSAWSWAPPDVWLHPRKPWDVIFGTNTLSRLALWLSGKESACQCRRRGFDPWSRKIPHAVEKLSLCATAIEPVLWSPGATATGLMCCSSWSLHSVEPVLHKRPLHWEALRPQLESSPCFPPLEKSPHCREDPAEPKINK